MLLLIICGTITVALVIFGALTKGYNKELFEDTKGKGNELADFYPIGFFILNILRKYNITLTNSKRRELIGAINLCQKVNETENLFNIRRLSYVYVIITLTMVFSTLYLLANMGNGEITDYFLNRPGYGESSKVAAFKVNGEAIEIEVDPTKLPGEQLEEIFDEVYIEVKNIMLGNNESLDKVRNNLNFINTFEKYGIALSWRSDNPELIDINGNVNNDDLEEFDVAEVNIALLMKYYDYEIEYEIAATVIADDLTPQERQYRAIKKLIETNNEQEAEKNILELPREVNNQAVVYSKSADTTPLILMLLGGITAIAIFFAMDKELQNKEKERKKQMLLDYAEIVSKITILTGAGFSVKNAWMKIVNDYERQLGENMSQKRYAYEELKITANEMQLINNEARAYMEFARRCNVLSYVKLGSMLEQNVKKGTKGLNAMLEAEAKSAFLDRKNMAKKLGEEAGTKLLLPMIMMLGIVMIIVIVPAMTSFGM